MAYKGIRLSDEEQTRYADGGESIKALDSNRFIMKNFAFQGPEEEVLRLLSYVEAAHHLQLTIYRIEEGFARAYTSIDDHSLISDFPMLKATGFVLETNKAGKIEQAGVVFKDSGFRCVTDYKRLIAYHGDIDANTYAYTSKSYCWPLLQSPIKGFTVRYAEFIPEKMYNYPKSGKKIRFVYEFPFDPDWSDGKYIFWKDNEIYQYDTEVNYEIENRVLISYKGSQKTIGIPSNVDAIGPEVFKGNTDVISINLPALTEIGASAFEGCSNLKHITFKKTLRKIGEDAFANCEKLVELEIPDMVREIGNGAFLRCGVGRVVWPKNTKVIPTGMFRDCPQLYEVVIPPEVEEIGRRVFSRSNTVIIYGQIGSVAEKYARDNDMYFKPMDF